MLAPVITEKSRLSIDAPTAQRVFGTAIGLVFAAVGTAFVLLPLIADGWLQSVINADTGCPSADQISGIPEDLLPPEVRDCVSQGSWFTAADGLGPARWIGLCGLPFVFVGLYLALSVLRTAAWLDGTRATVRRAFGTRTVDLATATITAGAITHHHGDNGTAVERVPTLIARDPASGRTITIPLRGPATAQLPPAELRGLAAAIEANPDADARNLANQLRTMADNPLGLITR
jgi:hypothetical protein